MVRLEDGQTVMTVISDAGVAGGFQRGDDVLLDARGKVILGKMPLKDDTGEEAQFERRIFGDKIEISIRGDERYIFDASQGLITALDKGEVSAGNRLIVCMRRRFAKKALPPEDRLSHLKYIDRRPVPNVSVEKSLGDPPPLINKIIRMVELEMTNPDLRRRYNLRRCLMTLLEGISGSGKSFSLQALIREIYKVMSNVTGVSIGELPPRVLRFRSASVLSKWFGESDKNIDCFFSEVEQLASDKFTGSDKKEYDLPVIAVLEEIDGLTRARGQDAIYDRILTTILDRLDPTREELKDKLILFFGTTNVAHQIDMAFLRRIGGEVVHFGRCTRRSFIEILKKHLSGLPFVSENGLSQEELLNRIVSELTTWLYSPNGEDHGQVSLYFIGSTVPEIRYRRDFITPGLIDRAVQQAATLACDAESIDCENSGIDSGVLKTCFHDQVHAIVRQLRVQNVANYLELPEGVRVQNVQPIEQPAVFPVELLRRAS